MRKAFCDSCESEITDGNPDVVGDRLVFKIKRFTFELLVATDGKWNGGQLCEACAKKLIQKATVKSKYQEVAR